MKCKVEGAVRRTDVEDLSNKSNENWGTKWAVCGCSRNVLSWWDKCLESLTNMFNYILFKHKLPEEWMLISLVPIFTGKGDLLN